VINTYNGINGKNKNIIRAINSRINTNSKIANEGIKIKVLINMPRPIEKPTRPFLYSFLMGSKKVCTRIGVERRSIMYLSSSTK